MKPDLKPSELHKHHAAHDRMTKSSRVDLPGGMTVRIDGGSVELRRAAAYRLAFSWNMNEGLPTERLEAGVVSDHAWASAGLASMARHVLQEPDSPKARELLADRLREWDAAEAAMEAATTACDCEEPHDRNRAAAVAVAARQTDLFEETP